MQDWFPYFWYEFTYLVSNMAATLGFSLKTEGRTHIPSTGPALVIANHQSFMDPVLVALATRRHLSFLARKTLFKNAFFAKLIASLDAFPIDQEGVGKEGLKMVIKLLGQNKAVLVFPEGTRTEDGQMNPFKRGLQLLISRSKTPIIPVGIAGAYEAWPLWRPYPIPDPLFLPPKGRSIAVVVGQPLDGAEYASMPGDQMLNDLFQKVKDLHLRADQLRRK